MAGTCRRRRGSLPLAAAAAEPGRRRGGRAGSAARRHRPALVRENALAPDWQALFDPASLCVSHAADGAATIATDFRQDARGYTRILVIDHALTPAVAGALVQRLLEVETYRCFALLGLPEAQRVGPIIGRIERELLSVAQRMKTATGLESNAALLDTLVAQAAELEAEAALSSFRFGATRAYEALVRSRLSVIGETPLEGHSTWAAFLDRRFAPPCAPARRPRTAKRSCR